MRLVLVISFVMLATSMPMVESVASSLSTLVRPWALMIS